MRWLLAKDLRILSRSPAMVVTLVVYPIVIALLIALSVASPSGRPEVAIYSGVPSGKGTIALGSQQLSIAKYERELFSSISPLQVGSAAAAVADVRSGRALAALVIPADIDKQVQGLIASGQGSPRIRVIYNTRNPLETTLVKQAIQTRVDEVQQAISAQVVKTVITDLEKVLNGGKLSLLGSSIKLLGLKGSRGIVERAIASLPRGSKLIPELKRVADFSTVAIDGLALAAPDISSIGTPLTVNESELNGRTTPASSYEAAIAAVVLLMFVSLLLGAGMLALERSQNAYRRLVRGLVSPEGLLGEKLVLAAGCAFAMALVTAAGISAFVTLEWARFALWILSLGFGAAAFAALGVAVGALARDVSVASLLAFLISLPVAFVALVPASSVSSGTGSVLDVISFLFPFRAALDAVSNSFSSSGPAIGLSLLHLLGLALAFFLLARSALARASG
jgi:ABC-type transport system involved in cytochrome c biogenesis permease component